MEEDLMGKGPLSKMAIGQSNEPTVELSGLSEDSCSSPTPNQRRRPGSSDDESDLNDDKLSEELDVPQLDGSLTPWRSKRNALECDNQPRLPGTYLDTSFVSERSHNNDNSEWLPVNYEPTSPINSRPHTRNSLFSEGYLNGLPAASASSSSELEQMQKQLTNYKLRIKVLTEVIKEINLQGDRGAKNLSIGKPLYDQILHSFSSSDRPDKLPQEVEDLKQKIKHKDEEITELTQELLSIKKEYTSVLEDINAYLEQSDMIAGRIDSILEVLMDNDRLSNEERASISESRSLSAHYLDIKLESLNTSLRSLANKEKKAISLEESNSTAISMNETSVGSISMIDSRLESAIESMHHEYRAFLQTLRAKLENSRKIENVLGDKLERQRFLLGKFIEMNRKLERNGSSHSNKIFEKSEIGRTSTESASNEEKSSNESQSDSSKKSNSNETNILQSSYGDILVRTNTNTDGISGHDLDNIQLENYHLKENQKDWESERDSLKSNLSRAKEDVKALQNKVGNLENELIELQEEYENAVSDLEKTLQRAVRKSSSYITENQNLHEQLRHLQQESLSLINRNDKLHQTVQSLTQNITDFKRLESELDKFKRHLLLHLNNMFDVFDKILQKSSIIQAKNKLKNIESIDTLKHFKTTHVKLESLYVFIETAVDSIVEEHAKMLLKERERTINNSYDNPEEEQSSRLRIELLERKWTAERERRKLDAEAAESRIAQLEAENEYLQRRLQNISSASP